MEGEEDGGWQEKEHRRSHPGLCRVTRRSRSPKCSRSVFTTVDFIREEDAESRGESGRARSPEISGAALNGWNYRRIAFQSRYHASPSRLRSVLSYRIPTTPFFYGSPHMAGPNVTVVHAQIRCKRTDVLRKAAITDVCNAVFASPRKSFCVDFFFLFLLQNRIWTLFWWIMELN